MKVRTVFLLLLSGLLAAEAYSQEPRLPADLVLKNSFAKAAKEQKKVFVIFTASWCGWCRKMDNVLAAPAVAPLIKREYHIVHLTAFEQGPNKKLENPGTLDVLNRYGGSNHGIPYWIIFDPSGKKLADSQIRKGGLSSEEEGTNSGCPATPEEIEHFRKVLSATSTLNTEEIQAVLQQFVEATKS